MMRPKATPLTTRERLHALLHELNFKGMQRVLDADSIGPSAIACRPPKSCSACVPVSSLVTSIW